MEVNAGFQLVGPMHALGIALVVLSTHTTDVIAQQGIIVQAAQPNTSTTTKSTPKLASVTRFLPLPPTRPATYTVQPALEAAVREGAVQSSTDGSLDSSLITNADAAVQAATEVSIQTAELRTGTQATQAGEWGSLDVNAMISRPLDGSQTFSRLKTDRHFFDGAFEADSTRLKLEDSGPYLWNAAGYFWQSPAFCFSPLYFEQPNYERYGQGKGKPYASTVSAVRFLGQVTTLPIAVFCTPPWSKSCTLGHHRPGDYAPYQGKSEPH